MKRSVVLFTLACVLVPQFLDSCHSSRKAVSASYSPQPRFINNVSISPHNKSSVAHNAIDHRKYRSKPVAAHIYRKPIAPIALRDKYAAMIGVHPNQITNFTLYRFIDKWYGTNYRLGGSDNSGIDCSGFAQKLYDEVYGIDLVRTALEQFSSCRRIKHLSDAREGDLVFFHIGGRRISHVGVYLANDFFVHASVSGGVMISSLNEDYWHKCYAGCGRVPAD